MGQRTAKEMIELARQLDVHLKTLVRRCIVGQAKRSKISRCHLIASLAQARPDSGSVTPVYTLFQLSNSLDNLIHSGYRAEDHARHCFIVPP